MTFKQFEDIIAWQKSQDLAVFIYTNFGQLKDFSYRDQICRASVSVSNNIAEGFDRSSDKDFVRFLYISKASNSEVKSMLYLAKRLNFIEKEAQEEGLKRTTEINKLLNGLIKAIE
jgi:four helix bundle protein